jgi:hypothetical protein
MINLYIHPRNTITMVNHLTIQWNGWLWQTSRYNTLAVAALEGVVQGQDARFLLNYVN